MLSLIKSLRKENIVRVQRRDGVVSSEGKSVVTEHSLGLAQSQRCKES